MPERWERELSKLRDVEPAEGAIRGRMASGPRGDGPQRRGDRIVAGIVAGIVAIAAAGFLWRTLPGPSDGAGGISEELPVLSVSFHDSEVVPEGPDSSYRRVPTSIAYGDARDEDFTTTTPVNAIVEWVAAEDLTHFVPGPTAGSRIEFDADGDAPRALLGRPKDWPNFDAMTPVDRLPDVPGEYLLVFEASYPEGIARTARLVNVVEPSVLQLVLNETAPDRPLSGDAFLDGRVAHGHLGSRNFTEGDLGLVQSEISRPSFGPDAWLPVPIGSPIVLAGRPTSAMAGLFTDFDAFDPKERLPIDLRFGDALVGVEPRKWLLAVEATWEDGKIGYGQDGSHEEALFFFPIEAVTEQSGPVQQPTPNPSPIEVPEDVVTIDIHRSPESVSGDPRAVASFGGQEVRLCPDGWSLVNPDGTSESAVFDCGQEKTFTAPAGVPIVVSGDFAFIEATAWTTASSDRTRYADHVPEIEAGSDPTVHYRWEVSWADGSRASFWLRLTVADVTDDGVAPATGPITIAIDDDGAVLEYANEVQEAFLGDGYQSETGELVEWFERASEVTRFFRVPRDTRIEVHTEGGSPVTFAIGRPGSGEGSWIMTDDSPPPYDILSSDSFGPVRYVMELLVRRSDGSWVDAYFGIELFATDIEGSAVVPDVMGLSQDEAERLIADAGLGVEVKTITSGLPESEVYQVRPIPGSVVFPDTVVTIHVSRPSINEG